MPTSATSLLGAFAVRYIVTATGHHIPAGSERGPQARFQPSLQAGQRLHVRPLPSGQDVADDGEVHAGDLSDLAQGGAAGHLTYAHGEESDGLSLRVVAGHLGPAGREFGGSSSAGAHIEIVGNTLSPYCVRHPEYVYAYTDGCGPSLPSGGPTTQEEGGHAVAVKVVMASRSTSKVARELSAEE